MVFIPAAVTEDYNKNLITLDRERSIICRVRDSDWSQREWLDWCKYSLIPLLRVRCRVVQASSEAKRCPRWVCAVPRRRSPVSANPNRQTLQPEATGELWR